MTEEQDAEMPNEEEDLRQQLAETQKALKRTQRQLEKSQRDYEELRQHVEVLSAELHEYRTAARQKEQAEEKPFPDWSASGDFLQGKGQEDGSTSIADSLKAAAEEAAWEQSGFVYDSTSGLYYDHNSGYYYDSVRCLYYDPNSTAYYYYDEAEQTHKFHSYASWPDSQQATNTGSQDTWSNSTATQQNATLPDSRIREKRFHPNTTENADTKKRKLRTRKRNKSPQLEENVSGADNAPGDNNVEEEVEVDKMEVTMEVQSSDDLSSGESDVDSKSDSGELADQSSLESSSEEESSAVLCAAPVHYSGSEGTTSNREVSSKYPPCIRVIVQSSDAVDEGSFFLVTCTGGTIGREKDPGHALHIPDINVSKMHAAVKYDNDKQCYMVEDTGSVNGTYVNNQRIAQHEAVPLCHGDTLWVGSTQMLLHIHPGSDTCDSCEPGQVMAALRSQRAVPNKHIVLSKGEKQKQVRQQFKNIKKKYGLQNADYIPDKLPDYSSQRAQRVGTEDPVYPDRPAEPASVHKPISSENKGHRMLAKMGWKEGSGLGKESTGRAEPVNVEVRANQSAGLGSSASVGVSIDNVESSAKLRRVLKTQERFRNLEKQQQGAESDSSQESAIQTKHHDSSGKVQMSGDAPRTDSDSKIKIKMNWVQGRTQKPS